MSMGGQGTKWRRNIAENFSRLSRAHKRYRQTTDDKQTDDDIYSSSRSLKTDALFFVIALLKVMTFFSCRRLLTTPIFPPPLFVYPVFFLNSATKK